MDQKEQKEEFGSNFAFAILGFTLGYMLVFLWFALTPIYIATLGVIITTVGIGLYITHLALKEQGKKLTFELLKKAIKESWSEIKRDIKRDLPFILISGSAFFLIFFLIYIIIYLS